MGVVQHAAALVEPLPALAAAETATVSGRAFWPSGHGAEPQATQPISDSYPAGREACCVALGAIPALHGSCPLSRVRGMRAYPFRLGRRLVQLRGERVGQPRHAVLWRVADDREVEILGMAHDRMLLSREAQRLIKDAL